MESCDKRDLRSYAAWGSFLCGAVGLLLTFAVFFYIDFSQKRPHDAWEARYFLFAKPITFLGVILGILGKDTPRIAGLVLSACVLLRVLGAVMAM
jgi:NADH:ubiquinone oxidoreductase subunit 6 (subunit J)